MRDSAVSIAEARKQSASYANIYVCTSTQFTASTIAYGFDLRGKEGPNRKLLSFILRTYALERILYRPVRKDPNSLILTG